MRNLKCPCCHSPLIENGKSYVCPNNHSFDVAKKGYVNLILANQGHAENEGDSKEMIAARKRFLESGHYSILKNELSSTIASLDYPSKAIFFADIACGEGYYTNAIHSFCQNSLEIETVGIDISKSAIQSSCSSRNALGLKSIGYVIGNLDYLPLMSESADVLLNCFAPINEAEFLRVAKKEGYYIRVLPDVYHLYEMKKALYEEVRLNEPKEPDLPGFSLIEEKHISSVEKLSAQEIADLFTMTPYYYKSSESSKKKLLELNSMELQIAFVIRIYKKN
ncbi:MAG: methyltransferase domain-containing protein [Bacilli bacterium]|nr:methyltransferase domain-containing protein [Bacilli bacterium]